MKGNFSEKQKNIFSLSRIPFPQNSILSKLLSVQNTVIFKPRLHQSPTSFNCDHYSQQSSLLLFLYYFHITTPIISERGNQQQVGFYQQRQSNLQQGDRDLVDLERKAQPSRLQLENGITAHSSGEMQKQKLAYIFVHGDNDFSICTMYMSQSLDPSSLKSLKVLFCLKVIVCLL